MNEYDGVLACVDQACHAARGEVTWNLTILGVDCPRCGTPGVQLEPPVPADGSLHGELGGES